jgi:hypothetical protein
MPRQVVAGPRDLQVVSCRYLHLIHAPIVYPAPAMQGMHLGVCELEDIKMECRAVGLWHVGVAKRPNTCTAKLICSLGNQYFC